MKVRFFIGQEGFAPVCYGRVIDLGSGPGISSLTGAGSTSTLSSSFNLSGDSVKENLPSPTVLVDRIFGSPPRLTGPPVGGFVSFVLLRKGFRVKVFLSVKREHFAKGPTLDWM